MVDWLSSAEIAAHRPALSFSEAERLVLDAYELEADASALPSDRDQNFRLLSTDGRRFVLRILSGVVPPERVDFEIEVLSRLKGRVNDVRVPIVVPAAEGDQVVRTGRGQLAYLVEWIEGKPYGDARPHTRNLLSAIGRTAAQIDAALAVPLEDAAPLAASPWDLLEAGRVVAENLDRFDDEDRKALLRYFAKRFDDVAPSLIRGLPRQVVHNDLNDYNLLVAVEPTGLRLNGILDVGDAHRSVRVADPVIASAYAALHWEDPVGAASVVAGAYNEILPLTDDELSAFLPMLAMRLCASVCISSRRQTEEAADPYVTISQKAAWKTLERLRAEPLNLGHYRLRAACNREPCRQAPKIRRWIEEHGRSFAPVSGYDLRTETRLTLDLSVSSPARYVLAEEDEASREIRAAMHEAGARIAIGRYNEVRLAYDNALFAAATLDGRVQRTVHLGVDLFMDAGSEVRAPLEGVIYGAADNGEKLSYGPTVILQHRPEDCPPFFTLYGHLRREDLGEVEVGRRVERGDVIGHVGDSAENGGWTPHLHFQVIADMLDRLSDFPGVCSFQDRGAWTSLCPDPCVILGLPPSESKSEEAEPGELVRKRSFLLGPSLSVSYDEPLLILRGQGAYMFDHTGRRYLDCVNNVNHIGHCHPAVVEAVAGQSKVLNTNTRYLHPTILEYARRLTARLPEPLSVCFFVNSGSEANDLALRIARTYTGRNGVIVLDAAYHGHLTSLIEVSPYKFSGPGGHGPGKSVFVAPLPDIYRGRFRNERASDQYASAVEACFVRAAESGSDAAAFLSESFLSCGGQIELPPGYLRKVYRCAREHRAVCIADEVQVGFGRVGTHFWGFETQDVIPDIVTMGKPIGNGHPLGAVVTTPEIAAAFNTGMEYFNTYGGNPVSCAAGLAVLDAVEGQALQAHALEVGAYLKERLLALQEDTPLIGHVRGSGLFLGVELVADRRLRTPATRQADYVINRARRLGVLLSTDGPDRNVLKIKPPLTFTRADADRLVAVLTEVFGEDPLI